MKREAKFNSIFGNYLKQKGLTGVFELKQTQTESVPFSSVEEHQINGLLAAEYEGFVWKLSDADPREKPFDMIAVKNVAAYVVIKYPKFFVMIRIGVFEKEKAESIKRKSLTSERARQIASHVVML